MKYFNNFYFSLYIVLMISITTIIFVYFDFSAYKGYGLICYIILMLISIWIGIMNRKYNLNKESKKKK